MNSPNLLEDQNIAWTPTPEVIERAQLTKFMRQVGVATWEELYAYSINDVERFTLRQAPGDILFVRGRGSKV